MDNNLSVVVVKKVDSKEEGEDREKREPSELGLCV